VHHVAERDTKARCKGVPQVMKTEVFNPCVVSCLVKGCFVARDSFAHIGEHRPGILEA
jgi:hypothetical protein